MKYIEYSCYLIIFLIPAYLIRFSIFGVPTNFLEVMIAGVFLALTACNLQLATKILKSLVVGRKLLGIGIALLFLGLILGVIISLDTQKSLGALKSWLVAPLVFSFVARSVFDTQEKRENALRALALSGISVACVGLVYLLLGITTFDARLGAFYESPNMLAMYIAPTILILSGLNSKFKVQSSKFLRPALVSFSIVTCYLLLVTCLFLTRSLGSIYALAVAIFLSPVLVGRQKHATIFSYIALFALSLPFSSLFLNPWEWGRSSLASRLMIWKSALAILRDHWFLGIGAATFQVYYLAYQKYFPPYLEWAVPQPHNIFLATWLYAGILGIAGFSLILFWFFREIQNTKNPAALVLAGLMIFLLVVGAIDNSLWRGDAAMMFWLVTLGVFG